MEEQGVTPGEAVDQQVQQNQAEETARQETPDFGQITELLGAINESVLSLKDSIDRSSEQRQEMPQEPERGDAVQYSPAVNPPETSSLEPLVQTVRDLVEEVKGWKESTASEVKASPLPESPAYQPDAGSQESQTIGVRPESAPIDFAPLVETIQSLKESLSGLQESNERVLGLRNQPESVEPTESGKAPESTSEPLNLSPLTEGIGTLVEEVRGLRESLVSKQSNTESNNTTRSEIPVPDDRTQQVQGADVPVVSREESDDDSKNIEAIRQLTEAIQKLQETTEKANEEKRNAEEVRRSEHNQPAESRPDGDVAGGFGFSQFSREQPEAREKQNPVPEQPTVQQHQPVASWQMQGPRQFPAQQPRQSAPAPRPASSSSSFTSPMESQNEGDRDAVAKNQQMVQGMQRMLSSLLSQLGQITETSQTMLSLFDSTQARLDQMESQIAQLTQAARGRGSRAQRNGRI